MGSYTAKSVHYIELFEIKGILIVVYIIACVMQRSSYYGLYSGIPRAPVGSAFAGIKETVLYRIIASAGISTHIEEIIITFKSRNSARNAAASAVSSLFHENH